MQLNVHLTFHGNCREAMLFYQTCLGGELRLQTIGEAPLAGQLPQQIKDYILHATLTTRYFVLMGSDMVDETGLIKGNAISLSLQCTSEEEITRCYRKFLTGGKANHPLKKNFWGALSGDLTDQFGNHWILHYYKNSHP